MRTYFRPSHLALGLGLALAAGDGRLAAQRAAQDHPGRYSAQDAAARAGDAGRGRELFDGTAGCAACHRINGKGPRAAPDLSDIGTMRSPAALMRSLLDPTAAMLPINRPVRAVTRDGRTIRGRRLNEDTYTVQLIDEQEQLLSLVKADLLAYEVATTSPMTSVAKALTPDERADLVAFLLTLKGLP